MLITLWAEIDSLAYEVAMPVRRGKFCCLTGQQIFRRLGMIALVGMMFSRMGKFVKNNRLARDIVLLYTKNGNISSQTDSQLGK